MNRAALFAASMTMCAFILPAGAADYYSATHFTSSSGDGEAALLINGGTVRTNDEGRKVADVASVNSGGVTVSIYTSEFDCGAHSWRVLSQTDYYIDGNMAPYTHVSREPPPFSAVNDGTPIQSAMNMVCNWPASMSGVAKIEAIDPIALNQKVSPTLKFTPPKDGDGR